MSIFSSYKKIFLLGFIIVILLAIPFSVYVAQKRQQTVSKAAASTILSFEPGSTTVRVNDTLTLNVMLDPGIGSSANQVSFVKLSLSFDASKFTTVSGSLAPNLNSPNTLTTIIDDPKYESGKATLSLSIGADPTKAVTTKTKIAIFQLKAIAVTTPTNPNITFNSAPNTQILSIAPSDQTSENVLSTTIPSTITVTSATGTTPTPSSNPTVIPGTGGSFSSQAPVCSNLEIDDLATGTAPYPLIFTATGSDSDGTISKISFNFGDSIEDLTEGQGIRTSSVSGQISHTYTTPGIYTAYAILTDNDNTLSEQQESCSKVITINSSTIQPSPIQPLPPTGDGKIIFGLGALGILVTIIGGVLFIFL